ncbi:MAG TPA: hypothetical protein VE379_08805, partial [Vicinamibacterales bacterium]|nr:hypothetical protein [Vicinamibacterales bacterium]
MRLVTITIAAEEAAEDDKVRRVTMSSPRDHGGVPLTSQTARSKHGWLALAVTAVLAVAPAPAALAPVPDKLVVLTFDDSKAS